MITFAVNGMPGTKGSVRAFMSRSTGRAMIVNDSRKAAPWAALVSYAARQAMRGIEPFDGPVSVEIDFYLPRPKSHYGKRGLKASAPAFPAVKPDGDKMLRCTWDALTGICFRDDAQIVAWPGRKLYGGPGAAIRVKRVAFAVPMPDELRAIGDRLLGPDEVL